MAAMRYCNAFLQEDDVRTEIFITSRLSLELRYTSAYNK